MARRHRLVTCLVPLAALAALCTACSSTSTPAGPDAATATITCSTITGSANFSPPLTMFGSAPETTSIALMISGCVSPQKNAVSVSSGTGTATITGGTSACTGLLASEPVKVTAVWSPSSVPQSVVSFSAFSVTASGGKAGFALPGTGKKVTVKGSFAGTNQGITSNAAVFTTQSATQVLTTCEMTAGLSGLTIVSGHVTLS